MELIIPTSVADNLSGGFSFEIQEGKHVINVPLENIGHLLKIQDSKASASIQLEYEYLKEINAIKLPSGMYSGSEAIRLILEEEGKPTVIISKNTSHNPKANMLLSTQKAEILEKISDKIVENANKLGLMVLEYRDFPDLPDEFANIKYVYKKGIFASEYVDGMDLQPEDELVPFKSTLKGIVWFNNGVTFYNVRGSSNDPPRNWIGVWKFCVSPASKQMIDDNGCLVRASQTTSGKNCVQNMNQNLEGGHVVFDQLNMNPDAGANGIVFIVPICSLHNNYNNEAIMNAEYRIEVLWLDDYRD